MKKSGVTFVKKELEQVLQMYDLIRDCAEGGESEIKRKKEKYLPRPESVTPVDYEDRIKSEARYKTYLQRAVFYNVARRTLMGSVGMAFLEDVEIKLSSDMKFLEENIDGSGVGAEQQLKAAVKNVFAYSRAGLLVDFPETGNGLSIDDVNSGTYTPTITLYKPENIINWRTEDIGTETVLTLVVLKETYSIYENEFEETEGIQYRVLRLDDFGNYTVEIWREKTPSYNVAKFNSSYEIFMPATVVTDNTGQPFKNIAFTFIGSSNNESQIDDIPFYDLCVLNLAHYRNSADYEEFLLICGQPTPVFTGLTKDWVETVLKGSINFGSRGGIPLPIDADAKLLQITEINAHKEAMEHKEKQMLALGARLVESQQIQRTATEVANEAIADSSYLNTVVKNVESAYNWAFKQASKFTGSSIESYVKFKMPTFQSNDTQVNPNVEA